MLSRLLPQNAAILIDVLTLIVLAIHPIPECVDCEYPNPGVEMTRCICETPFFAGSLADPCVVLRGVELAETKLARALGIVFAHATTQFRAGVTWASFIGNEGPTILIMDLFVGGLSLMAGHLAGCVYRTVRHKLSGWRP